MSQEDKIRDAFRDLDQRVARDVRSLTNPAEADRAGTSVWPGLGARPGLVIAGLAVIVGAGAVAVGLAGGGDGDQQVVTDSVTTTTEDGSATASTLDDDQTDPTDPDDGTDQSDRPDPGDVPSGRLRVAADAVAADADDPFLNVRGDPDARADLVAKLPASYTGLQATGQSETAEDGGTWIEVELLHPVAVADWALGDDRRPRGWVNRAFVEALPDGLAVGSDELAPCDPATGDVGGDGGLADGHVAAMESRFITGDCLRVVLTFGDGVAGVDWLDLPDDAGPADTVSAVRTLSSGGSASTIDLGPIGSAWPAASDTDDGLHLVRGDDGRLDLVFVGQARGVAVTARPEIGAVVVDVEVDGSAITPAGAGVVLTGHPLIGGGTIEVSGLSRPFEAVLGVEIEDAGGQPVEAVYSGNAQLGTRRTAGYGAATNDWIEAWGRFAVRVEGLDAGDYTLVLNANDAADQPETLRIPFTLEDGGPPPTLADEGEEAAALALIRFAQGGPAADLPLADEVTLLLGPAVEEDRGPADRLAEREAWVIDQPSGFGGFTGPFAFLPPLSTDRLRITAGPVPYCAGPPRDWPAELAGVRQVNIEPVGIDSCIAWFGVHLFLDDADRITAVALDLFGP